MFDAGFLEMLLIGIIALVIIGPERLPKVASTVGHWIGKAKAFVATTRTDIEKEFQSDEMRNLINKQSQEINELRDMMNDSTQSIHDTIAKTSEQLVDPTPFKPTPNTKKEQSSEKTRHLIKEQSQEVNKLRDILDDNTQSVHDKKAKTPKPLIEPISSKKTNDSSDKKS